MDEQHILRLVFAAKSDAVMVASKAAEKLDFYAEALRLLANVATGPQATCELLPGIAERLLMLCSRMIGEAAHARDVAAAWDSEAEAVGELLLRREARP